MKKELICISCPLGCSMEVQYDGKTLINVTGNSCKLGPIYAKKEIFNPERTVTSTVKLINSNYKFLPVKTDRTVSKELIFEIMKIIFKIEVNTPIFLGDVIVENILESGANLIATKTVLNDNSI